MKRSAPTSTVRPPTVRLDAEAGHGLEALRPSRDRPPSRLARRSTIAPAIGCSEPRLDGGRQRAARRPRRRRRRRRRRSVRAGPGQRAGLVERDHVGVVRGAAARRRLRKSTPSSAARPVPTMIEVGVARPIAHGHAMMSTATHADERERERRRRARTTIHTPNVSAAAASTAGTNHAVTRSTSAWIGSLAPCAASTMRMICASTVSRADLASRGTGSAPFLLIVPPTTAVARRLGDGHRLAGDHGLVDVRRALDHLAVDGDLVAGPDDDDVADGDGLERRPRPPRRRAHARRLAAAGRSSARIASPVRPLARASRKRPARMSVTMTAAAS